MIILVQFSELFGFFFKNSEIQPFTQSLFTTGQWTTNKNALTFAFHGPDCYWLEVVILNCTGTSTLSCVLGLVFHGVINSEPARRINITSVLWRPFTN